MKRVAAIVALFGLAACQQAAPPAQQAQAGPAAGTPEWKIQNAMSAAPEAIAKDATIMDWPAKEGAQMTQLRAGTNGWTCLPDVPTSPSNDPVCADAAFSALFMSMLTHAKPALKTLALSYMLQGSDDASNTDPFKTQPDSGQAWIHTGPHVMLAVPNPAELAGLPTSPGTGGPWVMFPGTPYAHVMMPVK
jgi:hypothetical protein